MGPLRQTLALSTLVWVLLASPLALVAHPEMVDWPNHTMRHQLATTVPSDPVLSQLYEIHWRLIPNLAGDLAILPLQSVLSTPAAGRLLFALAIAGC